MEAVIIKVYGHSEQFITLLELLRNQGMKIVRSKSEEREGYEEITVYKGVELEQD